MKEHNKENLITIIIFNVCIILGFILMFFSFYIGSIVIKYIIIIWNININNTPLPMFIFFSFVIGYFLYIIISIIKITN